MRDDREADSGGLMHPLCSTMRRRATIAAVVAFVEALGAPNAHASRTLAQGTLTDSAGKPTAGNVSAYAWPLNASGRMTKLATAQASADGAYQLSSPTDRDLARWASPQGGRLDIMVIAETAQGQAVLDAFTRHVRPSVRTATAFAPLHLSKALDLRAQRPVGTPIHAHAARDCKGWGTRVKAVKTSARSTVVGEINNAYRDVRGEFHYGRDSHAESTISTAISAPIVGSRRTGTGWRVGRGVTISNRSGASIALTNRRGPRGMLVMSEFEYKRYRVRTCGLDGVRQWYAVRPELWRGGYRTRSQRGTINVCPRGHGRYEGSGRFTRNTNRAVTFHRAADITSLVGPSMAASSQSGFSTNVALIFRFPQRGRHHLCGSHGQPPTQSPRVFTGLAR